MAYKVVYFFVCVGWGIKEVLLISLPFLEADARQPQNWENGMEEVNFYLN